MSANFNDEDDETWLYGAAANEETQKTKESNNSISSNKFGSKHTQKWIY